LSFREIKDILKSELQSPPVEPVSSKLDDDRALLVAVGEIASFAERLSSDFREQNGEIALLTFARTLRVTSHKSWAK
jgi:hypothetical protein